MKPTFHHRLINARFEDPCLYVRMIREKRAFLFDSGLINGLDQRDMHKITDVFVTHMHIDHFIGFDTLLRTLLRRAGPLRVYGPENIIECVEGKLKGYTWNLIKEYPLKIEVSGISERNIRHASFYAESSFNRIDRDMTPFNGIVLKESYITVKAACLSHGIPALGFSMEEDFHINIDKTKLNKMGLPVGPWLNNFKKMIRAKADIDARINAGDREFSLGNLTGIATITKGQKVSYIVDISPDEDNINKAVELVRGSDALYCEAYFLHKDMERALERNHLTARIAGEIAGKAGVGKLIITHLSPKYIDNPEEVEAEAMREFRSHGI